MDTPKPLNLISSHHVGRVLLVGLTFVGLILIGPTSKAQTKTQDFKKAQQLAKQKKWKKAIALLEPISDELPQEAILTLSGYYREIKDFRSQVRHLNNLIEKSPKRTIYHFLRGRAYSRQRSKRKIEQKKFDEEAVSSLRKAIELQPTFQPAYASLLKVFNRINNTFEARTITIEMVSRFGDSSPIYFTELCRLYIIDKYIDDGIRICQQAIARNPKEPINHFFLATGYIDKGDHPKAQAVLAQASKRFPNSAQIQEANGDYYLNKGNFIKAAKYFRHAIKKNSKLPDSHVGLAISHFERKEYDVALVSYVNACKLSRSKIKHYRLAITKLRGANKLKIAEKYEKQIYKCTTQL